MDTEAVSALVVDVCERLVLPRFRALRADEVEQKRPGDVVTVADREAEAELTAALGAADPGALVLGEEAAFARPGLVEALPGAGHAWVIDPVDGTRNFASGSPDFGVMVAEVRSGTCVRAWIWQPVHGRLYVVERGAGATLNGVPLEPLGERRRPFTAAVYPRLRREAHAVGVRLTHTLGSCAFDYPGLVHGRVDALAYRSLHPWDHLPGALLVTELGGFVGLTGGQPWRPGITGPLLFGAASREVFDAVDAELGGGLARAGRLGS